MLPQLKSNIKYKHNKVQLLYKGKYSLPTEKSSLNLKKLKYC